ncbi:hypothetical protein KY290_029785 [Solanum tuberosum]|uniref:Retrovirus-related Pol polyprotein from transposon TNT 1-94-like beta-barrel domain-containing protein n=1 Tax=Solanum tuberosum TaxID=4113 RepID=A0ABQ7UMX8_SOLTU|nr:hypothetical protein KY284_028839 [Solanum tuberosum]KAH0750553.1 hypothetical protein KY290_029785 [Solanum tuberosum]
MKAYGYKITNETIVSKVLRSLNKRFNHVAAAIEESRDLSNYGFDELTSSLQAYEDRLNVSQEKGEEKAFQIKGESSFKGKSEVSNARGYVGRGNFRGRGHGRGRAQFRGKHRQFKSNIQCRHCRKMGHKEADCWTKQKDEQQHANFTEQQQDEGNLFMAHSSIDVGSDDIWIIDSGCSNHMSERRSLFKELDKLEKSEVHLGNDNRRERHNRSKNFSW